MVNFRCLTQQMVKPCRFSVNPPLSRALYAGNMSSQTEDFHSRSKGRWFWNNEISMLNFFVSVLRTISPYHRSKNPIHPIQCEGT